MVTYGPWIQGDDVPYTLAGFAHKDIRRTMTSGGRETQHTNGGNDSGVVSDATTTERDRAAVPDWTADDYDKATYGCAVSCVVAIGPTQDAPYPFTTGVTHSETGFLVRATGAQIQLQNTYASTIPLPPGATGVELESRAFAPLSALITANMRDTGSPNSMTGLVVNYYARPGNLPVGTPGRRLLKQTTRSDGAQVDSQLTFQLGRGDLDEADGGKVIVWPEVAFGESPPWEVTIDPPPRSFYTNIQRVFAILSASVDWMLRPPRHRFVYEVAPGLPPLRQLPRDDNLGTSSAARIWPVSSQQGSLRRHGYF